MYSMTLKTCIYHFKSWEMDQKWAKNVKFEGRMSRSPNSWGILMKYLASMDSLLLITYIYHLTWLRKTQKPLRYHTYIASRALMASIIPSDWSTSSHPELHPSIPDGFSWNKSLWLSLIALNTCIYYFKSWKLSEKWPQKAKCMICPTKTPLFMELIQKKFIFMINSFYLT